MLINKFSYDTAPESVVVLAYEGIVLLMSIRFYPSRSTTRITH